MGLVAVCLALLAAGSLPALAGRPVDQGCDISGKRLHYSHGPRSRRLVALTFDSGPQRNTAAILRILRRKHVKATFFVVGAQVPGKGRLLRRELAAGHVIGNHTYTHAYVDSADRAAAREIDRASAVIARATGGYHPCLFRAPGIRESRALYRLVGSRDMITIGADVESNDWHVQVDAATIVRSVLAATRSGSIVLMHDDYYSDSTVRALPAIIDGLRARGFRFATVTRLLDIPSR